MNYLFFSFFIFLIIYLSLFYKQLKIDLVFLDRKHTTILKGIAILFVLFSHIGGKFGLRYLTPLGGIGVALFLLCSGYGLFESYKRIGLKDYWKKRVVNVLLPYFIIQTIVDIVNGFNITFFDYLKDISLIDVNHPFGWYMQFLFLWYILFYLIKKMHFLSDESALIIFYIISALILLINKGSWPEQAFSFTLGITASMFYNKFTNISKNITLTFMLLLVGIIFLAIKQLDYVRNLDYIFMNLIQLFIKLPIALSIFLIVFQFKKMFNSRLFLVAGNLAFELYLIHGYMIFVLDESSYMNIILFLISTIILTYAFRFVTNVAIKVANKY